MTKTRIRVKQVMISVQDIKPTYFPERKGVLTTWVSLQVSCTAAGEEVYSTYSLDEAKKVIDFFLEEEGREAQESFIEYPAPPATTEDRDI